jgi:hypothetical protein
VFGSGADRNGAAPFSFYVCLVDRVVESNGSESEYSLYIRNRELPQKESNPTARESLHSVDSLSKVRAPFPSPVHLHSCAATRIHTGAGHVYLAGVLQQKDLASPSPSSPNQIKRRSSRGARRRAGVAEELDATQE